jgi:putative peptidoglycan lipid II flippase
VPQAPPATPSQPAPASADTQALSGFVRGSWRIAGFTLVSRILGLVRDQLQFNLLGARWENAMFVNAWLVPNLFRSLFGEGALSAAFVPAFTRTLDTEGHQAARKLLAAVTGAMIVALGGLLLLVLLCAFLLPPGTLAPPARGAVDGLTQESLLRDLIGILFPYMLPICLVALFTGAVNATGRFGAPSIAPALLNAAWIAVLVFVGVAGPELLEDKVRVMCWALLGGGLAQLMLLLIGLGQARLLVRPDFSFRHPGLRQVAQTMAPMVLGLSVVQLNVLVDQEVALHWVPREGANALIYLGNRLLLFPQALVGTAMATAVFPLLSLLGGRKDEAELSRVLGKALSLAEFLALPAAAGLFVLAPSILEILFRHGRFTEADSVETSWVLRALVAGLPFMTANQIQVRALYALGETRAPVRIALALLVLNLALNLVLSLPLGVAGLAVSTSLCALLNCWFLQRALDRKGVPRVAAAIAPSLFRSLACAVGMALAVALLQALLAPLAGTGRAMRGVLLVAVPIAAGAVVFFALSRALGGQELRALLAREGRATPRE